MKKLEFIAKQKELQEKQSAALQARNIDLAISLSKELSELTATFEKSAGETALDLDAARAFVSPLVDAANKKNADKYAEISKLLAAYNSACASFAETQKNDTAGIWKDAAAKFGDSFGKKVQPHSSQLVDGVYHLGVISFTTHERAPRTTPNAPVKIYRVRSDADYSKESDLVKKTLDAIGKTYRSQKFCIDAYNTAHKAIKPDAKERAHLKLSGKGQEHFSTYLESTGKKDYESKQAELAAAAAAKVQNAEKDAANVLANPPVSNVKTFSATGQQKTGK